MTTPLATAAPLGGTAGMNDADLFGDLVPPAGNAPQQPPSIFDDLVPKPKPKPGIVRSLLDVDRGALATASGFLDRTTAGVLHLGSAALSNIPGDNPISRGARSVGAALDAQDKRLNAEADARRDFIVGNDPNKNETASQVGQVGAAIPLQVAKYAALGPAALPVLAAEAAASKPDESSAALLAKGARLAGNPLSLGDVLDRAAAHPVSRALTDLAFNLLTEGAVKGASKMRYTAPAVTAVDDAAGSVAPKMLNAGHYEAPAVTFSTRDVPESDPTKLLAEQSAPLGRATEGSETLGPAIPIKGVPLPVPSEAELFGDLVPASRQLQRGSLVTPPPVGAGEARIRRLVFEGSGDVPRASVDGPAGPAVPPVDAVAPFGAPAGEPTPRGVLYDAGGAAAAALKTRPGKGALLSAGGYGLTQTDDERLQSTGRGIMGLGMLYGFAPQIRALGSKAGETITEAMSKSPVGVKILNTLSHDILADPAVKQVVAEAQDGIAESRARARELSAKSRALGPVGDRAVSDVVEGEHFEQNLDPKDVPAVVAVAEQVSREFTNLGNAKVQAGLLTPETLAKRDGSYLPRVYAEHEAASATTGAQGDGGFRVGGSGIRDDALTPENRNQLGEIREASYRTQRGIERGGRDVATAKLFNALSEMPGVIHPDYAQAVTDLRAAKRASVTAKTPAQQAVADQQFWAARGKLAEVAKSAKDAGYVTMPDTRAMGALAGATVRPDVAAYLNAVPDLSSPKDLWGKILKPWKVTKTAYNPGTNSRNFIGNIMLAHMGGMPMQTFPKWWAKGLEDYRSYGKDTRYLAERGIIGSADPVSGDAANGGTLTGDAALRNLARTTRPETKSALDMAGITPMGNVEKALRSGNAKVQAFYGAGDGVFRVGFFKKLLADGVPPAEAAARTHEQFVHYDTRSPLLGALRNSISPFIMFPAKAIPMVLNQIVDHPERWLTLAAMWGGLDQVSRRRYGAMDEHDLPVNQRNNSMLGYLLPGKIQVDAIAQPIAKAAGTPIKPGTHPTIDVGGLTPLAGLTGTTVPGAVGAKFGLPSILQPSGPAIDVGARAFNVDPYTGQKWMTPADETSDKAAKVAGALGTFALPSAAAIHVPRVAGDVRNNDGAAAALDALGFAGVRPGMVRHGVQQQADRRAFESASVEVRQDLRRDLINAVNSPERQRALRLAARAKLVRLEESYRASVVPSAPAKDSERPAYTPPP